MVEVTADDAGGGGNNSESGGPSAWAPEMLAWGVEAVPCFVLLLRQQEGAGQGQGQGGGAPRAVARSGRPRGRAHARRSLAALVRLAAVGPEDAATTAARG